MFIVHVHVRVKKGCAESFAKASRENGAESVKEPGIVRFDVIRRQDDPDRFVLVEVYRTPGDAARHKETPHYRRWKEAVEPMMAEPRQAVKFDNVFPSDDGWR